MGMRLDKNENKTSRKWKTIQGGRILSTEDVIVTYYVDTMSHLMCSPARLSTPSEDNQ